jgi:hypothetical protein
MIITPQRTWTQAVKLRNWFSLDLEGSPKRKPICVETWSIEQQPNNNVDIQMPFFSIVYQKTNERDLHQKEKRKPMKLAKTIMLVTLPTLLLFSTARSAEIAGEVRQWHNTTLTFDGPDSSEQAANNPFLNYRMTVTFSNNGQTVVVPGYFAADGDAANSGATAGNQWRCHFVPSDTGQWTWTVSFRRNPGIALDDQPTAGKACAFDGETGSFNVAPSD